MIDDLQALKVAADELLVLKVPWDIVTIDETVAGLKGTPFENRVLLIADVDVEFAVVKK